MRPGGMPVEWLLLTIERWSCERPPSRAARTRTDRSPASSTTALLGARRDRIDASEPGAVRAVEGTSTHSDRDTCRGCASGAGDVQATLIVLCPPGGTCGAKSFRDRSARFTRMRASGDHYAGLGDRRDRIGQALSRCDRHALHPSPRDSTHEPVITGTPGRTALRLAHDSAASLLDPVAVGLGGQPGLRKVASATLTQMSRFGASLRAVEREIPAPGTGTWFATVRRR